YNANISENKVCYNNGTFIDNGVNNTFENNEFCIDMISANYFDRKDYNVEYEFYISNLVYNTTCNLIANNTSISTITDVQESQLSRGDDTVKIKALQSFGLTHNWLIQCYDDYNNYGKTSEYTINGKIGSLCIGDKDCDTNICCHNICRSQCPYCGDGYCDFGESSYTCSADCGSPPSGGGTGGGGGIRLYDEIIDKVQSYISPKPAISETSKEQTPEFKEAEKEIPQRKIEPITISIGIIIISVLLGIIFLYKQYKGVLNSLNKFFK
ncbi:MAG: hypothetical protein J7K26_04195, partial [Candidatus Aenigmarchaeota archaeon]|nr:hypothetical protein [Candidatus Aenigmarchaeota archaeon]